MTTLARLAVPCAALLLASCSAYDLAAYRNASIQPHQIWYAIEPGTQIIVKYCHERSLPVPDAAWGFCLYLPIENGSLRAGAVLHFTPQGNPAYLSRLQAPLRRVTTDVEVEARVVALTNDGARLAIRANTLPHVSPAWRFQGEQFHAFAAVPAAAKIDIGWADESRH
jgi:hypothetical protein